MTIHRRGVMGLGLAGAALAARVVDAQPTEGVSGSPAVRAAIEDIRRYAAAHVAGYGLPGMIVAVVAPGGVTATMQLGRSDERRAPIRPDQLFQVGSISKSFTALCVYQLVEARKLSLSTDARTLLPEVPWPEGPAITIQQLLNHSSGLPDDAPMFPQGPQRLWRGYEPASHWSYSNLGFALLSTIVERVEGRPFAAVLQARVLDPLGMRKTRPAILNADRALYAGGHAPLYGDRSWPLRGPLTAAAWTEMQEGSGCVASTAADMALYLRYLIAAGQGHGAPLLSDAGARRFTTATVAAPDWSGPDASYANGLAVIRLNGHEVLQHTGGMLSFNSCLHADPAGGVGAFASTNVGMIDYRPRDVTAYAVLRLRAALEGTPAPKPPPAPPEPPPVTPYLGRYASRSGAALQIVAGQGELRVVCDGQAPIVVEPSDENLLIASEPSHTPFAFVFRRTGGKVVRLWWGGEEFVRSGADGPVAAFTTPAPRELARLTGHYASNDPWVGGLRITAQGDRLYVDDLTPLTALGGGLYRVGEKDWSPERILFDAPVDGRPTRAIGSGAVRTRQSL
jgi:D-alanyl-D-alanine carboxypeptidase